MLADGGGLDPKGPVAETMAELWWLMLALGALVFVGVVVLLVLGLLRGRRDAESTPAPATGRSSRWLIGGGVVMPVLVLVVVFGATVAAMRDVPTEAPAGALVVEVIGHQWWWEVRYPEEEITTANELHLPVGRAVSIELTLGGCDPQLLGAGSGRQARCPSRRDEHAGPRGRRAGRVSQRVRRVLRVAARQHGAGRRGRTAGPVRCRGWTPSRGRRRTPATPRPGVAGRCFSATRRGALPATPSGARPPTPPTDRTSLTSAAVPRSAPARSPTRPTNLADWVRDPHTAKDGVGMPASRLSDEELEAVVAYLETLE